MTTHHPSGLPTGRDADAAWIDHQVATRLFGAMPRQIGRYTILETLGSGGMGLVYRAHDAQLERMIAVKLLNADHCTEEGARRLRREAQVMARLSHANVVQVYEVGAHHEQVFLAMEYIEGETLEAWLRRRQPREAILAMFRAIAEGIAAAHGVGITHRDLKPTNILVDAKGRPKVADFGLARTEAPVDLEHLPTLPDALGGNSRVTAVGQIVGTPRYMAPEQHAGQRATASSDQFSFCMMLWEALCGDSPYPDPGVAGAPGRAHWTLRGPPRTARLPRRVRDALTRGLHVEPSRRWRSVSELLAELGRSSWWQRFGWGLIPLAVAAAGGFVLADAWTTPPAEAATCDPERDALLGYERNQIGGWRTALEFHNPPPEVRRYLDGMLDDWSSELRHLCDATRHATANENTADLLRRGACVAQRAELFKHWLTDGEGLHRLTGVSGEPERSELGRPVRWETEGLERSCLLTEEEGYDLVRGAPPPGQGRFTQEILQARMLVHLGYPDRALALIVDLKRHLPAVSPATYHLLHARILREAKQDTAEVLDALYAAENQAELTDDLRTLFDARIEQVRVAIHSQSSAQHHNQVAPLPALGDPWERKLISAATTLSRLQSNTADDRLRLLATGVALAESRAQEDQARSLHGELIAAADRARSPTLRSEIYSNYAGTLEGSEAAMYDAKAIALAPADDELRAYLNYSAGWHALGREDIDLGVSYMKSSAELYRRAFGPETARLTAVDYEMAFALHTSGESAVALPHADGSVRGDTAARARLQLAISLYLRSAIHIRLGSPGAAVKDLDVALASLPPDDTGPDNAMWRTMIQTGRVEAAIACGYFVPGLELAAKVRAQLDADPRLDMNGQRDELHLATAIASARYGRFDEAAKILRRADLPGFLQHDRFKRAEALLLRAGLPGVSAYAARAWRSEAAGLLRKLGTDGALRLAAEAAAPRMGRMPVVTGCASKSILAVATSR